MRAVVMKFGGTSVADADAIRRLVGLVRAELARGSAPVVVVSAMSAVTDRLLALARAAAAVERTAVQDGLTELAARHAGTVEQLVAGPHARELNEIIHSQFEEIRALLIAVSILRDASPRSLDGIAAAGELLSSRIVSAALAEDGVPAVWVDARRTIITDETHTCAAPLADPTRDAVSREVLPALCTGMVPVVGGFVGATRTGATTTLGRGGSDYSAALIGAALDVADHPSHSCAEIQIWTDVDGMLTADPRIVDAARPVPELSFGEASELAYFGAKVLHPSTILPAVDKNIPVRILNSRRPAAAGTLITARTSGGEQPLAALACKRRITVIEVTSTRMLMAHGFLRRLFEVFERHRTAVDVVTTSEVSVSVTVDDDRNLEAIAGELRDFAEVQIEPDMALLCAVGDSLRADACLAVRMLGSLEGFPLRMVSQAASRRNLTVVLHERDLEGAMGRLHEKWFAPLPEREPAGAGT